MSVEKVLSGHVSPETAYVVSDYPYGFRLRCQIRYWIETKIGHGSRVVTQTTNPKKPGIVWNKPKASTYTALRVLFLDENGHVQNDGLHIYAEPEKIDAFAATYAEALTSKRDQDTLVVLHRLAAAAKRVFAPKPEAVSETPSV